MILYRNDSWSGSGTTDIFEVIRYEVCDLRNTDILSWCMEKYPLSGRLWKALKEDTRLIGNGDAVPTLDIENDIRDLIKEISDLKGYPLTHALWLARKEVVENRYDGTEENMSAYITSFTVLSDLGPEGALYAYGSLPQPVPKPQD